MERVSKDKCSSLLDLIVSDEEKTNESGTWMPRVVAAVGIPRLLRMTRFPSKAAVLAAWKKGLKNKINIFLHFYLKNYFCKELIYS